MDQQPCSDADFKKKLTAEQYEVLRNKGTERPYTGKYYKHKETGMYLCAACGNPLFSSEAKFDSQSGWPSFDKPVNREQVILREDTSHDMKRTEVLCKKCGGHLGHVFDDGPVETTGQRFCINSLALDFQPKK
jgi:peptide-methionine (R)-S-oxide reductase